MPNFLNAKDPAYHDLHGNIDVWYRIITHNFIIDNYIVKQQTEVDVDALVYGINVNELVPIDYTLIGEIFVLRIIHD